MTTSKKNVHQFICQLPTKSQRKKPHARRLLGITAPSHGWGDDIFDCVRERFRFEDTIRFDNDDDDDVNEEDAVPEEIVIKPISIKHHFAYINDFAIIKTFQKKFKIK